MDREKKSTLEEFMKSDKPEEVKAENKADTLSLDEPKKRTWLVVLLTVLATLLIAAGAYVAWQSYKADKTLKSEEKIENPVNTNTVTTTTTATEKFVYINAPEGLNLRKEANATSEVLAIVPNGTKLAPLETSGDWYKTTFNNKTGWIAKLYTSDTDPLVYKNTTYGFQITFPATWNYKFFPTKAETGVTAGYYVAVPTADTKVDESASGIDKGYASLFAISIYTPSQWDAVSKSADPKPIIAVQNASYVIAYSLPNGIAPTDLAARVAEARSVIATIKFF